METAEYSGPERRKGQGRRFTDKVRSFVWRAMSVFIVVYTATIILMYLANRERAEEGQQAAAAICTFKADLARRIEESEKFLDDVHAGNRDPVPGITEADIQRSIDGMTDTYNSLTIDCPTSGQGPVGTGQEP